MLWNDFYFLFQFAKYFEIPNKGSPIPTVAPIIKLDVERNFPVDTYYIDDLEDMVCIWFWIYIHISLDVFSGNSYIQIFFQVYEESIKEPQIHDKVYQFALKLIIYFESLDRRESRAAGISDEKFDTSPKPTVLVFLPGIFEIKQMYNKLERWVLLWVKMNNQKQYIFIQTTYYQMVSVAFQLPENSISANNNALHSWRSASSISHATNRCKYS